MEFLKITGLCLVATVAYGIAHDQVTARLCVEYFTIGHPPVFGTDSPTTLAFGWGVLATWWLGLLLGLAAAGASRLGTWPTLDGASLVRPASVLILATALVSLVGGIAGYVLARAGAVWLLEPLASRVPPERHHVYLAVLWSHIAGYAVGTVGGLALCLALLVQRRRMRACS